MLRELEIEAKDDNLDTVIGLVAEEMEKMDCPPKIMIKMSVAVEEIFVNIAHYAYGDKNGSAKIQVESCEDPRGISITFIDQGVPYDPLAKTDPDVTLSAEEREIGGLGIFMVKESMDDIDYEYMDCKNILHIRKLI